MSLLNDEQWVENMAHKMFKELSETPHVMMVNPDDLDIDILKEYLNKAVTYGKLRAYNNAGTFDY